MAKKQKEETQKDETLVKFGARVSFPYFFKKDQFDRYSGAFIVDPNGESENPKIVSGADADALIERAIVVAAKAKWPGKDKQGNPKYKGILKKLRATGKVCYAEGDDDREEYEGMKVLKASNVQRVKVRNRAGDEDLTQEDGVMYSGCNTVNVVQIWAQDNDFGRRINASLKGVQFWKDGDAFTGGGVASDDDFDDLSDGIDEDDEDEAPKSKKKKRPVDEDDEDEDEAPRKKKRRVVDEDDDDLA